MPQYLCFSFYLAPVPEEVLVDVQPRLPPLDVEVEAVGDREVAVVDDQHVTDVDLDLGRLFQ